MRSSILHGLIFLSLFLLCLYAKAQSPHIIRGKVSDESQKPLAGTDRQVYYDARPMRFDTVVHAIDSSFVSLKFDRVMYTYDPKKAASTKTNSPYLIRKLKTLDNSVTVIKLYSPQAIIDRTGAHQHFTDFLIEGKLAYDRVGDQLPFEYQPTAKN